MKIGQFEIDKSDIKAMLQSLFITMAMVLCYFTGRLASAYETTMVMNYLAGHPEYNVTIDGVRIKVTHDSSAGQFIPEYVLVNGSMVLTNTSNWGIWNPR